MPSAQRGAHRVIEELVDVRGKVRVVHADDGFAHELGDEEPDRAHRARGRDVDHIGVEVLGCTHHLQRGRERDLERFVPGHGAGVDGCEVSDAVDLGHIESGGGIDAQVVTRIVRGLGGVLDESAHAVDIREGVRELEDASGS